MSKQNKRLMASIVDKSLRDSFKQAAIQAQLYSQVVPEKEKKSK